MDAVDTDLLIRILDGLTEPVFVKDTDHRWVFANEAFCRMLGQPRERVIGHTDADYFPPEQVEVFYAKDDEVFAAGGVNVNEEVIRDPHTQTDLVIRTKKTVVDSGTGSRVVVGIIEDLTALRRAEEEVSQRRRAEIRAEEANLAKSRFLANMSHELRTPLNGVVGYAEMLMEEVEEPEQRDMLHRIHASSHHLLSMIDQVLDLSRIESGHSKTELTDVDIHEVLREAVRTIQPVASDKGITLSIRGVEGIRHRTDRRVLLQIVLNLAGNALAYAGPCAVELSFERTPSGLNVAVADQGVGIEPSALPHVFEKFWRANPSMPASGTGLGLSICRQEIERLGGTIDVESEMGVRTVFTIRLPAETA